MTNLELARVEEARQALSTVAIAGCGEPVAGGWMAFHGPGSWANQACGLGLAGPVARSELERLVAFYASRGVQPRIEVCSLADVSLLEGLAALGFGLREFEHVLARRLDAAEATPVAPPHGWPSGLELRCVERSDPAQVALFAETSASGFHAQVPEIILEATRNDVARPTTDAFLAYVDGELAGAAAMETCEAGLASLFGASVLPAFRRRGIQAALMLKRLSRAREHGAAVAVTHSAPGIATERSATKLGFGLVYAKALMTL